MIRAFHKSHLWMGAPSSLRKLRQILCRKINLTPRRLDRTGCGQSGLLVFRSGHVTEWILRGNVAARCPGPHPAPAAAKGKIGTGSALSPNYNEFCAEPREYRVVRIIPEKRERPVPDISHEKLRCSCKLAGVHVSFGIHICHPVTGTAPSVERGKEVTGLGKIR